MRSILLAALIGLLATALVPPSGAAPVTVYSSDFDTTTLGWSSANLMAISVPAATQTLGVFDNHLVTLDVGSLVALPAHDKVTLSFRLYTLASWDGHNGCCGPDHFLVHVDGTQVRDWTFAIAQPWQSYPDQYPAVHPATTGATWVGDVGDGGWGDAYYDITIPDVPHNSANLVIGFQGAGLQGWSDEGWVLDNVDVTVNTTGRGQDPPLPEMGTLALVAAGVIGVVAFAARRK